MDNNRMVEAASVLRTEADEERMQRLQEYSRQLAMTVRAGEVDRDKLIELVTLAMGSRSQRKFAADMGVNVSSISRILGGKVTEIGNELIAKIAVAADPDSGVTLEKLMEAQGIVAKEDRVTLWKKFEDNCRRIFCDELLKRGYSVSYPKGDRSLYNRQICDFEVVTDAIPHGEGHWLVETKMMTLYGRTPAAIGRTMVWLDRAMAYYYMGKVAGRISLIVDHRDAFDQLKERLSELTLKDEITVILISTAAGRIIEEYVAPLTDGREGKVVFGKEDNNKDSLKISKFMSTH